MLPVPRVSREIVDPMGTQIPKHPVEDAIKDLTTNLRSLRDELAAMRDRMQVTTDWSQDYDHNTNSTAVTRIRAGRELGTDKEPFRSLTVVSVGGGNLRVSINGRRPIPVLMGDVFRNEKIWTVDVDVSSTASGTAVLRLNAYLGGPTVKV